jgi:GR25 family glycosyltransferase involved in LPS biosynthesis
MKWLIKKLLENFRESKIELPKAYFAFIPKLFKLATKTFQVEQVSQGKHLIARISNGNYTSRETLAHLKEREAFMKGERWVNSSNQRSRSWDENNLIKNKFNVERPVI